MFKKFVPILLVSVLTLNLLGVLFYPESVKAGTSEDADAAAAAALLASCVPVGTAAAAAYTAAQTAIAVAGNSASLAIVTHVPVIDGGTSALVTSLGAIEAGKIALENCIRAGSPVAKFTLKKALDYALLVAQLVLIDIFTNKIVKYINDYPNGDSSKIFGDWGGDLIEAANVAGGQLITDVVGNLCTFTPNFNFKLLLEVPTIKSRTKCTLGDIGTKLASLHDDIKSGDWNTWFKLGENQNNSYALLVDTMIERDNQSIRKAEALKNEALAGRGLLSSKDPVTGRVLTPGATLQGLIDKKVGGPFDRMNNAIGKTVSDLGILGPPLLAISNALINKAIETGFAALTGTEDSTENIASYNPSSSDSSGSFSKKNLLTQQFNLTIEKSKTILEDYLAKIDKLITLSAPPAEYDSDNQPLSQVNKIQKRVKEVANDLLACQEKLYPQLIASFDANNPGYSCNNRCSRHRNRNIEYMNNGRAYIRNATLVPIQSIIYGDPDDPADPSKKKNLGIRKEFLATEKLMAGYTKDKTIVDGLLDQINAAEKVKDDAKDKADKAVKAVDDNAIKIAKAIVEVNKTKNSVVTAIAMTKKANLTEADKVKAAADLVIAEAAAKAAIDEFNELAIKSVTLVATQAGTDVTETTKIEQLKIAEAAQADKAILTADAEVVTTTKLATQAFDAADIAFYTFNNIGADIIRHTNSLDVDFTTPNKNIATAMTNASDADQYVISTNNRVEDAQANVVFAQAAFDKEGSDANKLILDSAKAEVIDAGTDQTEAVARAKDLNGVATTAQASLGSVVNKIKPFIDAANAAAKANRIAIANATATRAAKIIADKAVTTATNNLTKANKAKLLADDNVVTITAAIADTANFDEVIRIVNLAVAAIKLSAVANADEAAAAELNYRFSKTLRVDSDASGDITMDDLSEEKFVQNVELTRSKQADKDFSDSEKQVFDSVYPKMLRHTTNQLQVCQADSLLTPSVSDPQPWLKRSSFPIHYGPF